MQKKIIQTDIWNKMEPLLIDYFQIVPRWLAKKQRQNKLSET